MPRAVNSCRKAALSKPLSATSSSILVLPRPRLCFLMATVARVRVAGLISCGCALSQSKPIGKPLPLAMSITLFPFPALVRPTPSPPFWTARKNHQGKPLPIRFCLRGQARRAVFAKPCPIRPIATIHQIDANRWSANHIRLANPPTRCRFFRTYKMPFKHLRLSVRSRPRPTLGWGKSDSITCHCGTHPYTRLFPR